MLITLFDCVPKFLLGLTVTVPAPPGPAPVPTPHTSLVPVPTPHASLVPASVVPASAEDHIGLDIFDSSMFPDVPTLPPQDSRPIESIDLPPVDVDATPRRRHPGSDFQRIALSELESLRKAEFMPIASGARDALQDAADRKRAAKKERRLNWLRMGGDTEMKDDDTFEGIDRVITDYSEIATEYASLQLLKCENGGTNGRLRE
jgi:hypothetical protein